MASGNPPSSLVKYHPPPPHSTLDTVD
jgi:hypothetical protein